MPRIAIRTDASASIGLGHVMRCLTLADALRDAGCEVSFICKALPGHFAEGISGRGYAVTLLETAGDENPLAPAVIAHDAAATLAALPTRVDWLVADHYSLDASWETALRAGAERIAAVDDIGRRHDCDLLLDQNYGAAERFDYRCLTPARCKLLLGPRFALLRREFGRGGCETADRAAGRRVLVLFGGADAGNQTSKAVAALRRIVDPALRVHVVVGGAYAFQEVLAQACNADPRFSWQRQATDVAALMRAADLCIGAGGSAQLERAATGLPSLVLGIADNQRAIIRAMTEAGLILGFPDADALSEEDLTAAISTALNAPDMLRGIARRGMALVDCDGARRVTQRMLHSKVIVRPACADDSHRVWVWRNAPTVRSESFSTAEIPFPDHAAWFERVLQSDRQLVLIAEDNGTGIGVLRYEVDGEAARISIYLAPEAFGRGYGAAILDAGEGWLNLHRPQVTEVRAEVKQSNVASMRLFADAGYLVDHSHFRKPVSKDLER